MTLVIVYELLYVDMAQMEHSTFYSAAHYAQRFTCRVSYVTFPTKTIYSAECPSSIWELGREPELIRWMGRKFLVS